METVLKFVFGVATFVVVVAVIYLYYLYRGVSSGW